MYVDRVPTASWARFFCCSAKATSGEHGSWRGNANDNANAITIGADCGGTEKNYWDTC